MPGKTHRIGPSLIETAKAFASEESCHAYLKAARWPGGIHCLKCDHDKVSEFVVKGKTRTNAKGITTTGPDRFMIQCLKCRYQFSSTTGTIFSDTHLPLSKWMLAVAIMCNAKKSVSAKQMERDMGVSYKTAWFLNHRIRKAMDEGFTGIFDGVVEVDETYIGGEYDRRRNREPWEKQAVFGAVQRASGNECSKVRAFPIPTNSKAILTGAVRGNVSIKAELLISDEARAYKSLGKEYTHETVNHIQLEYKRKGDPRQIHTNSVEGFWSLFKRGLIGSFHKVSVKHLERYLAEFCFRFNSRYDEKIFAAIVTGLVMKSALRYKALTGPTDAELAASEAGERFDPHEPF